MTCTILYGAQKRSIYFVAHKAPYIPASQPFPLHIIWSILLFCGFLLKTQTKNKTRSLSFSNPARNALKIHQTSHFYIKNVLSLCPCQCPKMIYFVLQHVYRVITNTNIFESKQSKCQFRWQSDYI